MFTFSKEKRLRKRRIAELTRSIESIWDAEMKGAVTHEEQQMAFAAYDCEAAPLENEREYLRQFDLIARARGLAIEIPTDYYEEREYGEKAVLSALGELRLRKQVRDTRRTELKDWVSIVAPIGSVFVAVLSLLLSIIIVLLKR
jgi:hypothetical protein